MSWTTEQVQMLIDCYRSTPLLFMANHPDYFNKNKRSQILSKLITQLNRSGTTENDIKAKWNGLKTTYLFERRKVLASAPSGAGEDEIYKPKLWYYSLLDFLNDHVKPRKSQSNIQLPQLSEELHVQIEAEETCTEPADGSLSPIASTSSSSNSTNRVLISGSPTQNIHESCQTTPSMAKKKRKMPDTETGIRAATSALEAINNALTNNCDKDDYFALSIGQRIKNIKNKRRRLILMNRIENLIFETEMEDADDS